ncbi:MAG TPA: aminotransferase class V-fold PLP-dependent enzyme [Ktedonobacterales bacterium]
MPVDLSRVKIETLAVHAGWESDPHTGAVISPLTLSTTFERGADQLPGKHIYIRSGNPNRLALEETLALLEGGAAALAFSSGQAATMALLQALGPGDHVIAPEDAYYGTPALLRDLFARWGLTYTLVDMRDLAHVQSALRPNTRLVWIETPSNPMLRVVDIAAIAGIAHEAHALVACDNTWATPILQRPFELGADIVMHSTTKYLSGHSDVQGGALIFREPGELADRVGVIQSTGGAVPAPFDCYLVHRGIRTLPWRMRAHCENARRVAEHLAGHAGVAAVHYPGLSSHTGHAVAARQMRDFGGMLSFEVRGGRAEALALCARTQLFAHATSLGGPESLIEHRASVEGPTTKTPEGLLRVSVGLEHADDLIADFDAALGG